MSKSKPHAIPVEELQKLAAETTQEAMTLALRQAELMKKLAALNDQIASHTEELARRRKG